MPVLSLLPLEPAAREHSPVSDRAPPGWPDCWPGHFGLRPLFLSGRRPPKGNQDGVPVPLEKKAEEAQMTIWLLWCISKIESYEGKMK